MASALAEAVATGDMTQLEQLLASADMTTVEVNAAVDDKGNTALHLACAYAGATSPPR